MAKKQYELKTTIQKALKIALTVLAAFAAGVAATEFPTDVQTGGLGLVIAIIMASLKAYNNIEKNKDLPGNPLNTSYPKGYLWPVIFMLALMPSCTATSNPNGSTTYQIDREVLELSADRYERLLKEKAELEEQSRRARGQELIVIENRIRAIVKE